MWHTLRRAWLTGLLAVALPGIAVASATLAASSADSSFRYVAVFAGDCERLVLTGDDRTAGCGDKLVNVDFGDGRVAFVFTSPAAHGAVVTTFVGHASTQKDLRNYRLVVDEVATTTTDAERNPASIVEKASGHCAMTGDPTQERARFECAVEHPTGRTTGTFLSAGTPTVYAGDRSQDDASGLARAAVDLSH